MPIPLPALGVQPPQSPDLLGELGKLQQLRNMAQAGQIQQQQLQGAELENKQRQNALTDQEAMTKAMHEWDGKNLEDLPSLILKNGGSANAIFSTKQQIVAQKEKLAQISKDELDNQAKRNDMLLGHLQTVTDGPSLLKAAQDAASQGLIDPQHLQQVQQMAQLPPDQLKQTLSVFEKSLMGQKAQFDQAIKERETATAEKNANTTAARLQAELPGGPL